MQKLLNIIFLLGILTTFSLNLSADESELVGSWIEKLPPQEWKNGHFRYRVFSIWQKNSHYHYSDFLIYPDVQTRSHLSTGRVLLKPLYLKKSQKQIMIVINKGKGSPTPFKVQQSNSKSQLLESWQFDGKILKLGNSRLKNYVNLLREALENNDYLLAGNLFMINIYMLHGQMDTFGSLGMARYKDYKMEGLIAGHITLNFKSRGFLGLGNSGVYFSMDNYQQLYGVVLKNYLFGGEQSMDGIVSLWLGNSKVLDFDFSKIKVKFGIANQGYYSIHLVGTKKGYQIPVTQYGE